MLDEFLARVLLYSTYIDIVVELPLIFFALSLPLSLFRSLAGGFEILHIRLDAEWMGQNCIEQELFCACTIVYIDPSKAVISIRLPLLFSLVNYISIVHYFFVRLLLCPFTWDIWERCMVYGWRLWPNDIFYIVGCLQYFRFNFAGNLKQQMSNLSAFVQCSMEVTSYKSRLKIVTKYPPSATTTTPTMLKFPKRPCSEFIIRPLNWIIPS